MTWQVTPSRRGAPVPPSLSEEGAPGSVDEGVRAGFFLCAVSATTRANPSPGSQAQLWLCARVASYRGCVFYVAAARHSILHAEPRAAFVRQKERMRGILGIPKRKARAKSA